MLPVVSQAGKIWNFIKGKTPPNAVLIFPGGFHTRRPKIFKNFEFFGVRYKSAELATFINSFGDRVYTFGVNRVIYTYKRFSLGYTAGLIYGYGGKLSEVRGIPFKKSFFWTGNINPVVGLSFGFKLAKHLSLGALLEPLVFIYGIAITW